MSKKRPTFEEALRQLEEIAEQIEQGKIGLEESITRYEQGMSLVKQCREILAAAEHRIQLLSERPDGTIARTDFAPPAEETSKRQNVETSKQEMETDEP